MSETDKTSRIFGIPVAVITALIGVIGTVAVAWIGIVPQLRKEDQSEILSLKDSVSRLENRLGQYTSLETPDEMWVVRGHVFSTTPDGAVRPMRNAFVALLPLGNENLQQSSDDAGDFVFGQVPAGRYILLLAEPDTRISGRGIIEAVGRTNKELELSSATVSYEITPQ
jgi:hypothetical protein